MRKILMASALAIGATTFAAAPASSQVALPVGNLVPITIGGDVLSDILNGAEIELLNDLDLLNNNQIVVQAPISVAANVCDVAVNVLASDKSRRATGCTAESGSEANAELAKLVRKRIKEAQKAQ